ncbi:flavin reductase family protein [Streptomyces sp. NPDC048219]|uniref:flavin reductase family protein n=1 Tax=unclassified Streptomyces TaxID=2593676 RepID=UPI0034127CA5
MATDPGTFRAFFGSVPTAVAVVTAAVPDSGPQGFTCNSFTAVSADPPLLLVCADHRSRTLPTVLSAEAFVVHLLAESGADLGRRFAGSAADKFAGLCWRPSSVVGDAPVIEDDAILAWAECALADVVPMGDHSALVGRLETAVVRPRRPVLYQRGVFSPWRIACDAVAQA